MLEKFGIRCYEYNVDRKHIKTKKSFNVSLTCNSYNIKNPEKSYPENFDLRHDDAYVGYEIISENNTYCYYGD